MNIEAARHYLRHRGLGRAMAASDGHTAQTINQLETAAAIADAEAFALIEDELHRLNLVVSGQAATIRNTWQAAPTRGTRPATHEKKGSHGANPKGNKPRPGATPKPPPQPEGVPHPTHARPPHRPAAPARKRRAP